MSDAPQVTPNSIIARQLGPNDVGAAGFLKWMKVSMPGMYRDLLPDLKKLQMQSKAANLQGFGAFGDSGTTVDPNDMYTWGASTPATIPAGSAAASSTWSDSLTKLISAWGQVKLTDAQLDTAKQITQINLQRAQNGQAPLPYDASQLGLAPTLNLGLSGSTGTIVMYGGAAFIAYLVLNSFLKHKAR